MNVLVCCIFGCLIVCQICRCFWDAGRILSPYKKGGFGFIWSYLSSTQRDLRKQLQSSSPFEFYFASLCKIRSLLDAFEAEIRIWKERWSVTLSEARRTHSTPITVSFKSRTFASSSWCFWRTIGQICSSSQWGGGRPRGLLRRFFDNSLLLGARAYSKFIPASRLKNIAHWKCL